MAVLSVLGREPARYNGRSRMRAKEDRPVINPAGEPVIVSVPEATQRSHKEWGGLGAYVFASDLHEAVRAIEDTDFGTPPGFHP